MKTMKSTLAAFLVLVLVMGMAPAVFAQTSTGVTTIGVGTIHGAALKADGSVWAWGYDDYGSVGVSENNQSSYDIPTPVKVMDGAIRLCVDSYTTYAVKSDNTLWRWGATVWPNEIQTAMDGDTTPREFSRKPEKIMDGVTSVSAGPGYYMALKTDGTLWAQGDNYFSQLGTGNDTTQDSPIKVLENVKSVSAGAHMVCVIKNDGTLWTAGYGYLGNGTNTRSSSFVKVMDNAAQVSAGKLNAAVIKTDGTLWMWGENKFGQLGDGSTTARSNPVKIMDGVASVCAGNEYTVAVKTDGTLWAWGDNQYGQFGNGTKTASLKPMKIMDGVATVSQDTRKTFILKTDGTLWSCGLAQGLGNNGVSNDNGGANNKTPCQTVPIKILDGVMLPSGETVQPPAPASDKPSSWAEAQVNAAIAAKLVPQDLQSKYTQATTRAEFCALAVALYETYTGKEITGRKTFDDTKDMNVEKMAAVGVVSGTGNNKFSPDNQLTREQAAVMLSRLADAIGKPLTKQAATFADNGSVSSWALEGVGQVQAAGIMSGTGNNMFSPQNPYTREQSIITIMRLFDAVK